MKNLNITTLEGSSGVIETPELDTFRAGLRGSSIIRGELGCDEARFIWNGSIDKHPAIIIKCSGVADVIDSVNLARKHGILLAVCGGGHNVAGNAICNGGLVINLSQMNNVRVDENARRAYVGGGALLGDVDRETQVFGLATPLGILCISQPISATKRYVQMKQRSLSSTGFELVSKRTRKREFLDEMNLVVPWAELIGLIAPHAPAGKTGRPPFAVATMLRIHFMQQWFGLSDPAMEEALHDVPLYREFSSLDAGITRLPDESTILRFRHLLEANDLSQQLLATINATLATKGLMLKTGTVVDATLIAAPSSTKNSSGERDPEMHQTKKGNQWHFGMKAHIGVDAESGLVHTVIGTAANVNDVTQGHGLLHGQEEVVFADAGYQGAMKRPEATGVDWHVAMRPGKRRALNKNSPWGNLIDKAEQLKASVRAKVEHPFRVLKCQFGFTKVRYKGLAKNTAQLVTLFALGNLWMARKRILHGAVA